MLLIDHPLLGSSLLGLPSFPPTHTRHPPSASTVAGPSVLGMLASEQSLLQCTVTFDLDPFLTHSRLELRTRPGTVHHLGQHPPHLAALRHPRRLRSPV